MSFTVAEWRWRPLRIAVISYYLPSESKIGPGWVAHRLANALVTRGHDVTVFSPCARPTDTLYNHAHVPLSGSLRTIPLAVRRAPATAGRFRRPARPRRRSSRPGRCGPSSHPDAARLLLRRGSSRRQPEGPATNEHSRTNRGGSHNQSPHGRGGLAQFHPVLPLAAHRDPERRRHRAVPPRGRDRGSGADDFIRRHLPPPEAGRVSPARLPRARQATRARSSVMDGVRRRPPRPPVSKCLGG